MHLIQGLFKNRLFKEWYLYAALSPQNLRAWKFVCTKASVHSMRLGSKKFHAKILSKIFRSSLLIEQVNSVVLNNNSNLTSIISLVRSGFIPPSPYFCIPQMHPEVSTATKSLASQQASSSVVPSRTNRLPICLKTQNKNSNLNKSIQLTGELKIGLYVYTIFPLIDV